MSVAEEPLRPGSEINAIKADAFSPWPRMGRVIPGFNGWNFGCAARAAAGNESALATPVSVADWETPGSRPMTFTIQREWTPMFVLAQFRTSCFDWDRVPQFLV